MRKKVFITGITGFAGSHLAEYLVAHGQYDISGTYLSEQSLVNVVSVKDKLELVHVDLTEKEKVLEIVTSIKPDAIIHLAALPAVGASYEKPFETIMNNVGAQLGLLEAVRIAKLATCRVLIVTSADVYGKVSEKDLPIDEDTHFNPTNTYAVSKITQDYLAVQYANSYGLSILRARPFNHIGPRQATGFAVADFAKKIAEIEKGKRSPILEVGNVSTRRDFTDVRDVVKAYMLLIEKGAVGEVYNIGSGISHKISDILAMLVSYSTVKINVKVNKNLLRAEDAPDRRCDYRKLKKATGWQPTISLEKTLRETLEYWRQIR